ncbi:MAG: BLUF domain-containing protein [Burkholderiaceae bacterium]
MLRLIYASRSEVRSSVLDEMRRIRDHAVVNNRVHGIRVALSNLNGWFVQWIEGASDGVDALMARVAEDPRHHGVTVLHRSDGQPRLFRPWIGSIVQNIESDRQFHARVRAQLVRYEAGEAAAPAEVWLRLSAPPAPDMPRPHGRNPHVMLLSAQGTQAFCFLAWLSQQEQRALVRRRFAGGVEDVPDVESDYADFPGFGPRGLRLVANARKGLAMGMTHAFFPDYAAIVLLLDGSEARNQRLVDRVLEAARQAHHNPLLVGIVGPDQSTEILRATAQRQGATWAEIRCSNKTPEPSECWQKLSAKLGSLI